MSIVDENILIQLSYDLLGERSGGGAYVFSVSLLARRDAYFQRCCVAVKSPCVSINTFPTSHDGGAGGIFKHKRQSF